LIEHPSRKRYGALAALGACALLPAHIGAAPYLAEASQSRVEFSFTQAGARNSGRFEDFEVHYEPPPAGETGGLLDVTIDIDSLDTRDGDRDSMLRSGYFFEVDLFPEARFESTAVRAVQEGVFEADGTLTIRDVSRQLTLSFVAEPDDEAGPGGMHLHGSIAIRRLDYGIGQGEWRATTWIRNDVTIAYSVRMRPGEE
jgi:polyisoprenoid-binding protein YceI